MRTIAYATGVAGPSGAGPILEPAALPALSRLRIVGFLSVDATLSADGLLWLVASASQVREDALAQELVRYAHRRELRLAEPGTVHVAEDAGLRAIVEGRDVLLGARAVLEQCGIVLERLEAQAQLLEAAGCSLVYAAIDGLLTGAIVLADDAP